MATEYKGNSGIRETVDSGKITRAATDSMEIVKRGKYTELAAIQPAKGVEYVTGYIVEQSTLTRANGGWGELVINLLEKQVGTAPGELTPIDSFIEVDMAQVEKPLMTNKKLVTSDSNDVPDEVEAWRGSPQQRKRNYQIPKASLTAEADPKNDDDWVTLAGESLKVCQKISKGIECWLAFYPVVLRTSTYKARPAPSKVGKIDTPPATVPGTWVYLKTADRSVQNSKNQYVRTEQWTASDSWDTDLYES